MGEFNERRKYQRCNNVVCEALINTDGDTLIAAELNDISAAGLRFSSEYEYQTDEKVLIHLTVYNMLSEFKIKLDGIIIRVDRERGKPMYVMKFENMNKYTQVQLDELVRNGLMLKKTHEQSNSEEQYSLLLLPRFGMNQRKLKK